MNLLNGIKIYSDIKDIGNKLYINGGVQIATDYDIYNEKKYGINAYKPLNDWKKLSIQEQNLVIAKTPELQYGSNICIQKLSNSLIKLFKQLNLHSCNDRKEVLNNFRDKPEIVEQINEQLNSLLNSYAINEDFNFHRLVVSKPKLETLTYSVDGEVFEYIGLHIDRSTTFNIETAENSKNRVCINLSKEERYIFIINLTLKQIFTLLETVPSINIKKVSIDNIGEYFFKYFPDYPVIKLVQAPYEFYIAPTDNFLHDGCTIGKEAVDIALIYLGHFGLCPKQVSFA